MIVSAAEREAIPGAGRRWLTVVLLVIAAAALLIHAYSYNYVVDDAYISFRYARNLVEGKGLVFNPGERVEGYTNFLWVMLIGLGMRLGADPVLLAKILCLGFAVGTMVVIISYYRRVYGRRGWAGIIPLAMFAASPPLAVWAFGGLETTMFAFFVTTALFAHMDSVERGRVSLAGSGLVGLAALTRPEGMIFAAILFADVLLDPRLRRSFILWLVPIAIIYVPYFVWRYAYYGWLFPNTFYAKTGIGPAQIVRGVTYVKDFLMWPGGIVCLLAFVPAVLKRNRRTVLPLITCALWTCYVIAIGGDGLAMYRFAVPVLPICYLLSAEGLLCLSERLSRRTGTFTMRLLRPAVVAVCLFLILSRSLGSAERDFVHEDRIRVQGNWVPIGKWLGIYARPGESVAVTAVGALPYYSGLTTIDMLGITDGHISHLKMQRMGDGVAGHEKHDMEYVLSRKPTYIFHYPFLARRPVITRSQFETEWNPGLAELADMPAFRTTYEPVSEKIAGLYINFFRLKQEYR